MILNRPWLSISLNYYFLRKEGAKTVAKISIKTFEKTQVKNDKRLLAVTRNGRKRAIKNGKIVLKGVKGLGAKSFTGMGKRLMKKLGFDKFRFSRHGKRFRLDLCILNMKIYSTLNICEFHANHCEGFLVNEHLTYDIWLIPVLDGCIMGTKSVFCFYSLWGNS